MSLLNAAFDPARDAALVTGAGNGIGRAIALALVGEGVRTVFADVREDRVMAPHPGPSWQFPGAAISRNLRLVMPCSKLRAHLSDKSRISFTAHLRRGARPITHWRLIATRGGRCTLSISTPGFILRAKSQSASLLRSGPAHSCF